MSSASAPGWQDETVVGLDDAERVHPGDAVFDLAADHGVMTVHADSAVGAINRDDRFHGLRLNYLFANFR